MPEKTVDNGGKRIKSVETALAILDAIGDREHAGLAELADHVDYTRSNVHYHLTTLKAHRYIVKEDDGYRLGLRCLNLGGKALAHLDLPSNLTDYLDQLAEETGVTAQVAVEEAGKCIVVCESTPLFADETGQHGAEHHLHVTAFGKAIMASLPEDRVLNIVERQELPALTADTITESDRLFADLDTVRTRGIAFADEERQESRRSVAAPIVRHAENQVVGAVGIRGSVDDIDDPYSSFAKAQRFKEKPSNAVARTGQLINAELNNRNR